MDVVRVLAAVLLLGNVQFIDKPAAGGNSGSLTEVGVSGESTLNSVASLLGVPSATLFRGKRTVLPQSTRTVLPQYCTIYLIW